MYTENLVTYRFQRIVFRIILSPFLLTAIATHGLKREFEEMSKESNEQVFSLIRFLCFRVRNVSLTFKLVCRASQQVSCKYSIFISICDFKFTYKILLYFSTSRLSSKFIFKKE